MIVKAPIWDADPFKESGIAQKQRENYETFYQNLLPKISALQWGKGERIRIFSKDTISNLQEYRVTAFDRYGAVYHVARKSVSELLTAEPFPRNGELMEAIE